MRARLATRLALAALVALAPAAGAAAADEALRCTGNEPFWALTIEGPLARLERLGVPPEILAGAATRLDFARPPVAVWRGRAGSEADTVAAITDERCADTMADRQFPLRALVSRPDGAAWLGCCARLAVDPAARPAEDWGTRIGDLLPAIEACRPRAPADAVVVRAWPMNRGLAGVRWRAGDGERTDCVADLGAARVESSGPAAPDPMPGEGDPVFVPASRRVAAVGPCARAEPVGRGGWIAGFLVYRTCR